MDENGMASDASPNLGLSHTHSVASVDPNMQCPTSLADMQTRVRAAALAKFQALLDATFEVKLLPHVRSQFVGYFEASFIFYFLASIRKVGFRAHKRSM